MSNVNVPASTINTMKVFVINCILMSINDSKRYSSDGLI